VNIVYALSGEGRGHGSLARAILPLLQRAGHKLKVVTYGQSIAQLAEYDLIAIKGIRHWYDRRGRLSLLKSIFKNRGALSYYAANWWKLKRQLREFSPDIVIVNFEPFTARIGRSLRLPILSFDNQHALLHFNRIRLVISICLWVFEKALYTAISLFLSVDASPAVSQIAPGKTLCAIAFLNRSA
jgi:uncharacterized protein (TIGR00661 family)